MSRILFNNVFSTTSHRQEHISLLDNGFTTVHQGYPELPLAYRGFFENAKSESRLRASTVSDSPCTESEAKTPKSGRKAMNSPRWWNLSLSPDRNLIPCFSKRLSKIIFCVGHLWLKVKPSFLILSSQPIESILRKHPIKIARLGL